MRVLFLNSEEYHVGTHSVDTAQELESIIEYYTACKSYCSLLLQPTNQQSRIEFEEILLRRLPYIEDITIYYSEPVSRKLLGLFYRVNKTHIATKETTMNYLLSRVKNQSLQRKVHELVQNLFGGVK